MQGVVAAGEVIGYIVQRALGSASAASVFDRNGTRCSSPTETVAPRPTVTCTGIAGWPGSRLRFQLPPRPVEGHDSTLRCRS